MQAEAYSQSPNESRSLQSMITESEPEDMEAIAVALQYGSSSRYSRASSPTPDSCRKSSFSSRLSIDPSKLNFDQKLLEMFQKISKLGELQRSADSIANLQEISKSPAEEKVLAIFHEKSGRQVKDFGEQERAAIMKWIRRIAQSIGENDGLALIQ